MTRYETLKNKADLCRLAAAKTSGEMRKIWLVKAADLELMALNMPVVNAGKIEA